MEALRDRRKDKETDVPEDKSIPQLLYKDDNVHVRLQTWFAHLVSVAMQADLHFAFYSLTYCINGI